MELLKATTHLTTNDKCLSTLIKKIGKCNLNTYKDYFGFLIDSIIGQQLSSKAADSISSKFRAYFNGDIQPKKILETGDLSLRQLGLSFAKVNYIKDLSSKVLNKEIHLQNLPEMEDDNIIKELVKVKGIGVWTAHMFLIFSLGRLNVLPVGDLGIRKAIKQNYRLRKLPDEKRIRKISKINKWEPYNSVASWYLWRSLDLKINSTEE